MRLQHVTVYFVVFLVFYMEPVLRQCQELGLEFIELLQLQSTDVSVVLVAVKAVIVELRRANHACQNNTVNVQWVHNEVWALLEYFVNVHQSQHKTLVTAEEICGEPFEIRVETESWYLNSMKGCSTVRSVPRGSEGTNDMS